MRFRQLTCPTAKNFYDVCLNAAPFYQNELIEEAVPDHNYSRPWTDDPSIATALPRVQLFSNGNSKGDLNVEIDDSELPVDENPCTINWPPTIHTNIPETFDFAQEWPENLTEEQEKFLGEIRGLIDETRIASLCCELNSSEVVYWRISIHQIVFKLSTLFKHHSNYKDLLPWLHQYICQTFDRIFIGHYVDLFQILYHEHPDLRSSFVQTIPSWSDSSLCSYVYKRLLQKPNDLTEEVIYSITLPSLHVPVICLLIPGLAYGNHMQRVQFWERNLSQIGTVMSTTPIAKEKKSQQIQIQKAYEDILAKFHEIRQLYRNHQILFFAWNVGCILALKAALVCQASSIICMSLPFSSLSEETKNEFTQINASMLFITGERQSTNQIDHYRQRLKSRNGLIELGECDEQLKMSEDGKYRFRLTQLLVDKLIIEEILDFLTLLFPKVNRNPSKELEDETKRKKFELLLSATSSHPDDSNEPFLNTGMYTSTCTSTTLTIPPEQDPHSIFLNTILPPPTTTRKRKGSTPLDHDRSGNPTTAKRGRQKTKNLPAPSDLEWAPQIEKRPAKTTTKKVKQTMPPTATTSILNTLLQLPSHQPKPRTTDMNLPKSTPILSPLVNTLFSSNPFFQ